MTRKGVEAALALLFAAAILAAGGGVLHFFLTKDVHSTPEAVPSAVAGAPPARYAEAVEGARRLARSLVVDENLPALSVAVAHEGRIVWAEGFGWADIERREAATPRTRFRIGAVSKPLTAGAVGLLRDRGRLDLDAPVQRYVPAFPVKAWPVTTRHLMGDVAGVHHRRGEFESLPNRHCASFGEALDIFGADPLLFRPGTQYRYSVYGWVLVSAVVEGAAGEPFARFMTREVFEPLAMDSTLLDEADTAPGLASFYFPRMSLDTKLGMQDAPAADYSCWAGAGAFVSTPSDLVRFGSAMVKPGMLKADTLALLQAPYRLESGASSGYASGWKVESVQLGGRTTRMLSHRGNPTGGNLSLLVFPELELVVAAATNVSHAKGIAPLGLKLAETFATPAGGAVR